MILRRNLIWLAISFVLLYLIMSRFALPRVGKVLEERATASPATSPPPRNCGEDTEHAIAEYEQAHADAKARAQAIARQARDEMTRDMERQRAEVDQQISRKQPDAETRITPMKEAALSHIGEIATETAEALIARLLGKSLDRSELQGRGKRSAWKVTKV